MTKKTQVVSITRSSAAEYLICVAAGGQRGAEAVYADENVWLTRKMMPTRHDVQTHTVNCQRIKIFADRELQDAGRMTAEIARAQAETEFEKYRIVQDTLFQRDFDRVLLQRDRKNKEADPT